MSAKPKQKHEPLAPAVSLEALKEAVSEALVALPRHMQDCGTCHGVGEVSASIGSNMFARLWPCDDCVDGKVECAGYAEGCLDCVRERFGNCLCRADWPDASHESFDEHACADCHADRKALSRST